MQICPALTIPDDELELRFTRSGGPGGQHVNTSATKVELRFDLARSAALSAEQKARIRGRLGRRITSDGVLVLQADEYRSQIRNREAVLARFATLLADALRSAAPRRPTRPSHAARERRLAEKRRQAERKARRRDHEQP
jgi:ribosome-associated protein